MPSARRWILPGLHRAWFGQLCIEDPRRLLFRLCDMYALDT